MNQSEKAEFYKKLAALSEDYTKDAILQRTGITERTLKKAMNYCKKSGFFKRIMGFDNRPDLMAYMEPRGHWYHTEIAADLQVDEDTVQRARKLYDLPWKDRVYHNIENPIEPPPREIVDAWQERSKKWAWQRKKGNKSEIDNKRLVCHKLYFTPEEFSRIWRICIAQHVEMREILLRHCDHEEALMKGYVR